jgi:hypothetical protein
MASHARERVQETYTIGTIQEEDGSETAGGAFRLALPRMMISMMPAGIINAPKAAVSTRSEAQAYHQDV